MPFSADEDALLIYGKPDIFNSDQGSQYTAQGFINTLVKHNISISMDSKGRALDNIFMERFWRTIKYENIYPASYDTIKNARVGIDEYIDEYIDKYNNRRLHSALNYSMPMKVYRQYFQTAA